MDRSAPSPVTVRVGERSASGDLAVLREHQRRAAYNFSRSQRADFLRLDELAAFVLSSEELDEMLWERVAEQADEAITRELEGDR